VPFLRDKRRSERNNKQAERRHSQNKRILLQVFFNHFFIATVLSFEF
jgi:hypothetical protein